MPRIKLNQLIELLNQNSLPQGILEFKDDNWRNWRIELEVEYFPVDDSIPESELTDDDYEEVPRCDLQCLDNCYLQFTSFGSDYKEALLDCLERAELINS
ncbi:hypothetical protein [Nostoc sp. FACHB-190]|uniref:hypothetical protein n=1 Tax=Nostoc sp. FACHB-190 TaxID=2692838 RepID=UPI001683C28B|nr:hypothetical protein [Nostoc sp. FACHB-190]MBD2303877.1 hypothetical protein [Nostoc sp. FACHB-190]